MSILRRTTQVYVNAVILSIAFGFLPISTWAATLVLNIVNPNRTGSPGGPETFSGTISNSTGSVINSDDLFLNFAGFDSSQASLVQLLNPSFFELASGSTSGTLDLFTATLGSGAKPGLYSVDVVLQDINNDMSDVSLVSLRVVPEPAAWLLLLVGGFGLTALWRRRFP